MVVRKKSFRVGVGSTAITGHKSPDVTSPTNSSSSTVEVNFEVVNAAPSLMYMPRQLEIKVKEVASITTYRLPRCQDGSSNCAAVLPGGLRSQSPSGTYIKNIAVCEEAGRKHRSH